jgi:F0F1-type ATP synthase assembly protein I
MPAEPPNPKDLERYHTLAQVGLEMAAPVGLGIVLDYYLNWAPWGAIVGALFGLIAGVGHLYMLANRRDDAGSSKHSRDAM